MQISEVNCRLFHANKALVWSKSLFLKPKERKWIVMITFIFTFHFEHCKLNMLFHSVFFVVQTIIGTAAPCIC